MNSRCFRYRLADQRGVALIITLSVVALASSFAAVLIQKNQLVIAQAQSTKNEQRVFDQMHSALAMARVDLRRRLARPIVQRDFSGEPEQLVEIDGAGVWSYWLERADGRMNINNLLTVDGEVDPHFYDLLSNLFEQQGVAPEKLDAIADWLQPVNGQSGRRDALYQQRTPSYLAARQPMRSLTELRMVAGIDDEDYARLAPVLVALPPGSRLNLNAAPQAVLSALGAVLPQVDKTVDAHAQTGVMQRTPLESVQDFFTEPLTHPEYFSVESQFFLVRVQSRDEQSRYEQLVLLFAEQDSFSVIARTDQPCMPAQLCI